jgi:hypothetical protein
MGRCNGNSTAREAGRVAGRPTGSDILAVPHPDAMAHDVFLSYSSTDQLAALAVLHGLESEGIRCWMAPRDIAPGAIWAQSIMEGINGCRVLVVVFSSNANRSAHVINEVDAAVRKGAVVIPLRIEDVMPDGAMEYHLRTRHWLDALTPDMERHTTLLAEKIRPLLAGPPEGGPKYTKPPRPVPSGLPPRRRIPKLAVPKRARVPLAVLALVAIAGTAWLLRDKPQRGIEFEVKEVSSRGGTSLSVRMLGVGMRFFEGQTIMPELALRRYVDSFPVNQTRFIYAELKLRYDPPGREFTIPFACTVTRDGGTVVTTISIVAKVQATWNESYHAAGYGRGTPGWWQPGRHDVQCTYGGEVIFREWFRVVAGGAAAAPLEGPIAQAQPLAGIRARVASIALFPSLQQLPPEESRQPTTTFDSATLRYIGARVLLSHDAPGSTISATLNCRYLRDRDTEVGRVTLPYRIQSSWTSTWTAIAFGNDAPGFWVPGEYLFACDDGRRTLAQQRFTVR